MKKYLTARNIIFAIGFGPIIVGLVIAVPALLAMGFKEEGWIFIPCVICSVAIALAIMTPAK